MRKTRSLVPLLGLAMLLLLPGSMRAQEVLFSTLSAHDNTSDGWYGFGLYGGIEVQASPFTVPSCGPLIQTCAFTRLDLAVGCLGCVVLGEGPPPPYLFQVQLTADASGTPGTVLETWTISSPTSNPPAGVFTVLDAVHLQLVGGRQYWVTVGSSNGMGSWFLSTSKLHVLSATSWNGGPWKTSNIASGAFDVWGIVRHLYPPPYGVGFNQILHLVAGPVTPPAGGPVEANLGFNDLNGNAIGPSATVTINPGQIVSLDFPANDFIKPGERLEVVPVITALPSPNTAPGGAIQASVEVRDADTGFGTVFTPVPTFPPDPLAPALVPQSLAHGETMRFNVQASPSSPCVATLSFADKSGGPLGSSKKVSVAPGKGMWFDLNADTLGLKLGQHIDVQPIVIVTPPITAGTPVGSSACQASVEVFDHSTGRTNTYQTAPAQLPAVQ